MLVYVHTRQSYRTKPKSWPRAELETGEKQLKFKWSISMIHFEAGFCVGEFLAACLGKWI